jgi:hypothetical protein
MTRSRKLWLKSKLVLLGLAEILLGLADLAQQYLPPLLMYVKPETNATVMITVGVITILLRFVTHQPIALRPRLPEIAD